MRQRVLKFATTSHDAAEALASFHGASLLSPPSLQSAASFTPQAVLLPFVSFQCAVSAEFQGMVGRKIVSGHPRGWTDTTAWVPSDWHHVKGVQYGGRPTSSTGGRGGEKKGYN